MWVYKAWAFWKPWLTFGAYSRRVVIGSGIFLLALYVLAATGARVLHRDAGGRRCLTLFAVLFMSATIVHALTYSMIRYRLPYVDPYLCVLAGVAAAAIAQRRTRRIVN